MHVASNTQWFYACPQNRLMTRWHTCCLGCACCFRDAKPENILVVLDDDQPPEEGVYKLCDFGGALNCRERVPSTLVGKQHQAACLYSQKLHQIITVLAHTPCAQTSETVFHNAV